ncbi:MAG TPA: hypothetical protein VF691_17615 [Cytophagaceae bacterium]|jgi:phosphoribosylanthranilate isomerase
MALKIPVKVNSVNNLTDARYCAGMGVSMIGFNFDTRANNSLHIQKVLEISGWISGVEKVGEFEGITPEEDVAIARRIELDYIQFNTLNSRIKQIDFPVIQKLVIDNTKRDNIPTLIKEYSDHVKYFLIECDTDELIGLKSDIKHWCTLAPIILGFGVTTQNLDVILNEIKPAGISIQGGDEIRPGFKDLDELIDLLEALEIED